MKHISSYKTESFNSKSLTSYKNKNFNMKPMATYKNDSFNSKSLTSYITEYIIKKKLDKPIDSENNELAESIYKVFDIDDNELKDYIYSWVYTNKVKDIAYYKNTAMSDISKISKNIDDSGKLVINIKDAYEYETKNLKNRYESSNNILELYDKKLVLIEKHPYISKICTVYKIK